MTYLKCFCLFLFFVFGFSQLPLLASKKYYALIIANQNYNNKVGALNNPHKDAVIVRNSLENIGYEVSVIKDGSRGQILLAIEEYSLKLAKAGPDAVGFLYYSGHGAAKPNTDENYILPVSVKDARTTALWYDSISLEQVRKLLHQNAPYASHIVVFDACRNELKLSQRGGKGFVPVLTWGGMLLAYSTSPGQVASDGRIDEIGSPYARALTEELDKARGLPAEVLFSRVRYNMKKNIPGQSPWFHHGLNKEVMFGKGGSQLNQTASINQRPSGVFGKCAEARGTFNIIKDQNSCALWESYIAQYKSCSAMVGFAKIKKQELQCEKIGKIRDKKELASQLQRALKKVGCYTSRVDGDWGAGSRRALGRFNNAQKSSLPTGKPTAQALLTVSKSTGQVCSQQASLPTGNKRTSRKTKNIKFYRRGTCREGNIDVCKLACRKKGGRTCDILQRLERNGRGYRGGTCWNGNLDHCERACSNGNNRACNRLKEAGVR